MISVIIPVYKNKKMFLANLKHNLRFIGKLQIIVVNDNPEENLTRAVKTISPTITVINNPKNYGFGKSMNLGVQLAKQDYLLFLNSDVKLLDNRLEKALTMFKDPKLFALSFAQIEADNHITGANAGHFKQGLFQHYERHTSTVSENLWPEGGASLLNRHLFLKLGGFDEIYSPFYWEDVDLGFRAKARSLHTLYYPLIKVQHCHQTTISKYFTPSEVKSIAFRNQFLFVWKNIRGLALLQHLLWLPILIIKNRQNREFKQGLKAAFKRYLKQDEE